MENWKGNNKECLSGSIEGEPVKVLRENNNVSFIILEFPIVEYFKSKYVKEKIMESAYSTIKIYLN